MQSVLPAPTFQSSQFLLRPIPIRPPVGSLIPFCDTCHDRLGSNSTCVECDWQCPKCRTAVSFRNGLRQLDSVLMGECPCCGRLSEELLAMVDRKTGTFVN